MVIIDNNSQKFSKSNENFAHEPIFFLATNLFVTTRMLFMDVHLKYKAYRHYPGKPNDMNNIRLHQAISSSYDLIPHKENCLDDILRYKRSLVVLRNSRGETPNLCYDRFVDISDEIEKVFCKFEDWEH